MGESIVIALAGGLMGAVLAFPLGSFSGWQAHRRAIKEYMHRKAAEKREKEQEASRKEKKQAYDFTQDETIQFPCMEE